MTSPNQESQTTDLIGRAKGGEREAFEALLERCAPRLLPYARYRVTGTLRRRLESADLLQDVLLRAYSSFQGFQGQNAAQFLAWLTQIARNRADDLYREQRREKRDIRKEVPLDDALGQAEARMSTLTANILSEERQARLARLEEALDTLSEIDREIFVMSEIEELTFPQIGERLKMTGESCRKRLGRALARMTPLLRPPKEGV